MLPDAGEEVLFHGHPSWRSMLAFHLKGLALSVLLGAIAGLVSALVSGSVSIPWVTVVVLAVFVASLGRGLLLRLGTTYTVTDRRLTIEQGLVNRELRQTRLERVQNVSLRQSLLERALGVGTVDFDTAGGAGYEFSFSGVAEPRRIVRTIDRALGARLQSGA